MKLSLQWLKQFVDVAGEPQELKTALTNLGLGVESFAQVGGDTVFEVEVTTNRPDCLSHLGVARELATFYRLRLKWPPAKVKRVSGRVASGAATLGAVEFKESSTPAVRRVAIEIADPDLCARYCGRVIENVEVKPSPAWLAERLEAVGLRPINNVADVTNYVLMELGHPLHAFDLARLRGQKIIVRRARPGEILRTLDGVERTLDSENLVIADAERAVALAGVMGGQDSEISASTRAVLLESAWFDPVSIRRTAKAHAMHTEASHRFERGADFAMAPVALDRAAALIAQVAGGEVLRGIVDVYPTPKKSPEVCLRQSEILRILGAEIPAAEVERILSALGFCLRGVKMPTKKGSRRGATGKGPRTTGHQWNVAPPSWRPDVSLEVDLIEEIARHYGYDRLPSRLRVASRRIEAGEGREKELEVSRRLTGLGYHQIVAWSMVDPAENARFTDQPPVKLANPLSHEASVLRSTTLPSMLEALRWNLDRDCEDLRLYEVGKIYVTKPQRASKLRDLPVNLPDERRVLTLGVCGWRREASVHEPPREVDFFDLKGDLEALLVKASGLRFEPEGAGWSEPGLAGRFVAANGDGPLAVFGRLAVEPARAYKLRRDVWLAEVDYERLLELLVGRRAFRPFSKFPAVERDFSLLVPEGVPYSRLAQALEEVRVEEVSEVRPVERLPEGKIAPGFASLLLRVKFQSASRTLTGEEIAEAGRRLIEALVPLGVRLRS